MMKIAYLCDISPEHSAPYSGGNARIYQALRQHVGDVDILPQSWGGAEPVRRALYALPQGANLRLRWRLHLLLAPMITRALTAALSAKRYDVLFGAYSFQSLAALSPPYPLLKAFTSDASFSIYKRSEVGQSFGSSWLSRHLLDPVTLRAERKIYRNLDLALWPSEWLKREAETLYGLAPSQSMVVPWGANIDPPPAPTRALTRAQALTKSAPLRLLLVGRDWQAKGGPTAFETLMQLRQRGYDARLTVIGTTPPASQQNAYVRVHPHLDKTRPDERATFEAAFRSAHFMVQPSFESWGFAFCEAAAYGLPVLCLAVGGVPVRNGVSGHALHSDASATEFTALIEQYLHTPDAYAALRQTARKDYETRLNWDSWGKTVQKALHARRLAQ